LLANFRGRVAEGSRGKEEQHQFPAPIPISAHKLVPAYSVLPMKSATGR